MFRTMRLTNEEIEDLLGEHGRAQAFDIRAHVSRQSSSVTATLDEHVASVLTYDQTKPFRQLGDAWKETSKASARFILRCSRQSSSDKRSKVIGRLRPTSIGSWV